MTDYSDDTFGREFKTLDDLAKGVVKSLVRRTASDDQARAEAFDGQDAYAYRHPGGGIAWGVNAGKFGVSQAKGIWRRPANV